MTALLAILLTLASTGQPALVPSGQSVTTPAARTSKQVRLRLKTHMPLRQYRCLYDLWNAESGWRTHAGNVNRAYGIPQAFPGRRMASAGPDWRHNPATQVRWGRNYIRHRYGRPCAALRFQSRNGWY